MSKIPVGEYEISVWHPRGMQKSQKITVKEGERVKVDFVLEDKTLQRGHRNKWGKEYKSKY